MALPLRDDNADDSYKQLRDVTRVVRNHFAELRQQIASGEVNSFYLLTTLHNTVNAVASASVIIQRADPALVTYVRQITGQSALDVRTNIINMVGAMQAVATAIIAAYPKDANGFLLDRKFDADSIAQWEPVPGASLSAVDAAIVAWHATVT